MGINHTLQATQYDKNILLNCLKGKYGKIIFLVLQQHDFHQTFQPMEHKRREVCTMAFLAIPPSMYPPPKKKQQQQQTNTNHHHHHSGFQKTTCALFPKMYIGPRAEDASHSIFAKQLDAGLMDPERKLG